MLQAVQNAKVSNLFYEANQHLVTKPDRNGRKGKL
jgi:hypothetical protein